MMEVRFADKHLDALETDPKAGAEYPPQIPKKYRFLMQAIRAANDERDFYAVKSLHYEKLKGDRKHQRSMRLNEQWRLIVEIEEEDSKKVIVIVAIENHYE